MRQPNTTRDGRGFDHSTIEMVWNKTLIVPGWNPMLYRKDACGAVISRSAYGIIGDTGWEIDHIMRVAKGGGDQIGNLQPLQWHNNRHKGDDWPNWSCAVSARN
jgi:hypothetical protein